MSGQCRKALQRQDLAFRTLPRPTYMSNNSFNSLNVWQKLIDHGSVDDLLSSIDS